MCITFVRPRTVFREVSFGNVNIFSGEKGTKQFLFTVPLWLPFFLAPFQLQIIPRLAFTKKKEAQQTTPEKIQVSF